MSQFNPCLYMQHALDDVKRFCDPEFIALRYEVKCKVAYMKCMAFQHACILDRIDNKKK